MADNRDLTWRANLDAKGFEHGAKRVKKAQQGIASSTTKANKSTRRQSLAFVEVARGLEDAQYGFRGVQNNINQLAFTLGLSGPIILAITAAGVAINYLSEKWAANSRAASDAAKETAKALADAQGPVAKLELYSSTLKTAGKDTEAYKIALQRLKKLGFDPLNESVDDFIDKKKEIIKFNAIESATTAAVAKKLAEQITLQQEINEEIRKQPGIKIKDGKVQDFIGISGYEQGQIQDRVDRIAELEKQINSTIETGKKLASGLDITFDDIITTGDGDARKNIEALATSTFGTTQEQTDVWRKQAKRIVKSFADAWNIEVKDIGKLEPIDVTAAIKSSQEEDGIIPTKKIAAELVDLGQLVQSQANAIGSGIASAIQAGVSGEKSFGEAFLGLVGGFLIQLGTLMISAGIALLLFEAGLASLNPFVAIGAGIALVAAGALVSSTAKGGISGDGASGSSRSAGTATTTTPSSTQGSGGIGGLVATVRGQDLRFILQGADETYSGRN